MKPMNCPGHCLLFGSTLHSYRDLPLRYADFGVLHRNELSGALTGLTRVRRFQQDDAHIYCREDQIEEEVLGALNFMKTVYDCFGMTYKLELSTRPEKALGEVSVWDAAEKSLANAMDKFAGVGGWRENPGDGGERAKRASLDEDVNTSQQAKRASHIYNKWYRRENIYEPLLTPSHLRTFFARRSVLRPQD